MTSYGFLAMSFNAKAPRRQAAKEEGGYADGCSLHAALRPCGFALRKQCPGSHLTSFRRTFLRLTWVAESNVRSALSLSFNAKALRRQAAKKEGSNAHCRSPVAVLC